MRETFEKGGYDGTTVLRNLSSIRNSAIYEFRAESLRQGFLLGKYLSPPSDKSAYGHLAFVRFPRDSELVTEVGSSDFSASETADDKLVSRAFGILWKR
jgi:hypothetical protein